jgi:hypothetical protein
MIRQGHVQASSASRLLNPDPIRHLRYATPGQRSAYASGLSTYTIGKLWGNLGPSWVRRRLLNSGVTLRPHGPRQSPSAAIVEHFRQVAQVELAAAEQAFRHAMSSRQKRANVVVPFLPRAQGTLQAGEGVADETLGRPTGFPAGYAATGFTSGPSVNQPAP